MSDIARAWAAAQDSPNRNAHEVLKEMAQWADAAGETWILVDVLARACKCNPRTAQRGLAALKACGLIIDTGQKRRYGGRLMPIYQLPIETGPANLMQVIRAETLASEAAAEQAAEPVEKAATGDSGVTRSDDLGVTVVSPDGCRPCHPTGDSGVTQIGKGITQELTLFAGGRASDADSGSDGARITEAMSAWARKAPARVAPIRVRPAWDAALASSGWTATRLCAAVTACVAKDPDFGRDRAMALDRWLTEERFKAWDQADDGDAAKVAGLPKATWSGPNRVREIVAAVMGAGGVVSYLDPAGWDEPAQAVVAATGLAASRLRDAVGRTLAAEGFKICLGSDARG